MRVVYCAQARILAGCREEEWLPSVESTQDAFWKEAIRRHPGLTSLRQTSRLACGGRTLAPDAPLDPTQEIAILPPVSGG